MLLNQGKDLCCEEWARAVGEVLSYQPYSAFRKPTAQIMRNAEGTYDVAGCCGGGCNVLDGLRFCPWCGSKKNTGT